jgi:hypothetical protein
VLWKFARLGLERRSTQFQILKRSWPASVDLQADAGAIGPVIKSTGLLLINVRTWLPRDDFVCSSRRP